MEKIGNKVRFTVSVSEETAEMVKDLAKRFGVSHSAVIEVCVLHQNDELRQADKLLGKEGFNDLVKFLQWWTERPKAFPKGQRSLKLRGNEA